MSKVKYSLNKSYLSLDLNPKPVIDIKTQGEPISKTKVFKSGMVAMGFVAVASGAVMSLSAPQPAYADSSKGNPNAVYTLNISGGDIQMDKKFEKKYAIDKISHISYTASPKKIFDFNDDFKIQDNFKVPIENFIDEQVKEISYKAKPKSVFEF
ncbi:hypothetical protein CN266_26905 [Bacillus cereus]|uniref:hypothetical protein n=1 Tax=Bacillus cereus TaxID=1396 RepID=UPI000BF989BA|nr:hypothetical protein [Bacillus cereus]PFC59584.1 hypothetical protein CN266_26905 [Bacillus cereus]